MPSSIMTLLGGQNPVPDYVFHHPSHDTSEAYIYEPLTAGTLETLALGVPTSYKRVMALTCGELFTGEQMDTFIFFMRFSAGGSVNH